MKYIYTDDSGNSFFDVEKASKDGQYREVVERGKSFNGFSETYSNSGEGITLNGIPVWGNWCGPGHEVGPAKNLLDFACR